MVVGALLLPPLLVVPALTRPTAGRMVLPVVVMTTIACVLKSGGWPSVADVARLAADCAEHCAEHRFVCLSDVDVPGVEVIPLLHNWPSWWSKIETGRPGLFSGPCLYLDLDSVVLADITHMAGGNFAMLSDFYRPQNPASGMMAWTDDMPANIYADFVKKPDAYMECHKRGGDQAYIATCVVPERLQSRHPDEIVSYKVHCRNGVPKAAKVVCFHGQPKPRDVELRIAA